LGSENYEKRSEFSLQKSVKKEDIESQLTDKAKFEQIIFHEI